MAKSDLLRIQDVRDAYRLIGECRDLGGDPGRWYRQMLEGLWQLVGAVAAAGGEGLWRRPAHPVRALSGYDVGFDARGHERFTAYHREIGPQGDPIFRALQRMPVRLVTYARTELVSDAEWYRSASFNEYRRPCGIDHSLTSVYQVSADGPISAIALHRAIGERDFSPREQRLLHFFHGELGPLVGRALVSATEPSPERLSPRLRQTLAHLLEGDSEKQVAARLGLSQATTHQYVTMLYRRFGVRSRPQLLAHVLRRVGSGRWRPFALGTSPPEPTSTRASDDSREAAT